MDQTVDILGLCADTVGYIKHDESENQSNSLLESNLVYEASTKDPDSNGIRSKLPDDKKPLVYNTMIRNSVFRTIPKTKVEYLRLFGIAAAIIVSIVLLYIIFDTKSKVTDVGCKIAQAKLEIENLTKAFNESVSGEEEPHGQLDIRGSCSGTYNKQRKEITTPNYPSPYTHSKTCTWNIDAPSGKRVELRFLAFNLESASSCRYDWLQAYDGSSTSARKNGDKHCGSTSPSNIVSTGNRLFLKWRSDDDTAKSGFKITCRVK